MKKFFVLFFILLFVGCVTTSNRMVKLEQKVVKLEQRVITFEDLVSMGVTEAASASFYPFSAGLTGGQAGKLDKITSVAQGDTAIGILEADAVYGDAVMIYVADNSGDAESLPNVVDPDEAGSIRWKLVKVYGIELVGNLTTADSVDSDQYTDGSVDSVHISTIVDSIAWNAGGCVADGTQCADPAKVTINSGPADYTIICADNDGSTIYGHVVMPDSWNAGTVTFELEYLQTAADTGPMNSDICAMCRGAGETVNNTWSAEAAIDDAAVTGSNAVDHTTSGAVTANGTCAAGDTLYWRWQLDATGTTTAVATLHVLGVKMEYTSNVGD